MAANTMLDIVKRNNSDLAVGLIEDSVKAHPEVNFGAARTVKGLNYQTLVRTSLPTVAFRNANEGSASVKSTYANRLIECFIMNPQWVCDKLVADASEDGSGAFIEAEARGILEGAMVTLGSQFYYGTTSDAKGFPGLLSQVSSDLVTDASGTGTDLTSVWLVRWGERDVQWVLGQGGSLNLSEARVQSVADGAGNLYDAYVQSMALRPGLMVGSVNSIARIKNIGSSANKLTDALLATAYATFPAGLGPNAIYMNRRSWAQLQASRTATNGLGTPAPFPTEFQGVPIHVTDSITSAETTSIA